MTKIKDNKRFHGGMNTDDSPANLPDGDYVGMRNTRTLSSDEQRGAGLAETLQAEIELLINPNNLITYYGSSIGGSFVYPGFNEITIGTQTWMKKNYDGVYPGSKVYDDNEDNADIYGRLYTHGQIMTAGFCPDGWRVPTKADIDTLLTYLGGAAIAGGKLKETGEQHWTDPNTGATDVAGFRAVPGGKFDLLFDLLGDNSLLWLADEGEPVAPVAINGSAKTGITFVANWLAVEGVTGYRLDVGTDINFGGFVAGWNNKDVGNVLSDTINGLSSNTPYYYRIRAYNDIGSSVSSNIVTITTLVDSVISITTTKAGMFSFIAISGIGDVLLDWGDGNTEYHTLSAIPVTPSHAYAAGGNITISDARNVTRIMCNHMDVTALVIPAECPLEFVDFFNNSLTSFVTHVEWVNVIEIYLPSNSLNSFIGHREWRFLTSYQLGPNKLPEEDINNILIEADLSGVTTANIGLNAGGTNASPTGAGITAMNSLLAKGNNVSVN